MTALFGFKKEKAAIAALIGFHKAIPDRTFVMKQGEGKFKHQIWVKK